jgi:hypothetical protein
MKTLAICQPHYLPWPGHFRLMKEADFYVFADHVQFESGSWQCRNRIKTSTGWKWLTIPVCHSGLFGSIKNVHINNDAPWAKKHFNILSSYYGKSPYFEVYSDFFKSTYEQKWTLLSELNIHITKYLAAQLGLSPTFLKSSDLTTQGKRSHLALSICKLLKVDRYLSSIGAKEYMRQEHADVLFEKEGIQLEFLEYSTPEYPQLFGSFIKNLSFVDCLFNCGPESLKTVFDAKSAFTSSLHDVTPLEYGLNKNIA